jgi:hypothetical protein
MGSIDRSATMRSPYSKVMCGVNRDVTDPPMPAFFISMPRAVVERVELVGFADYGRRHLGDG